MFYKMLFDRFVGFAYLYTVLDMPRQIRVVCLQKVTVLCFVNNGKTQHRARTRLNQLQKYAFGCIVQDSFLTLAYMYSVGHHSRRSSSSNRNRTGKPYAAHLARLDYLLIYLPTQVQLTITKIIKIVATR